IAASIVGTAIGTLLLAQLDQRTIALLISGMVALFLARGDRLLGDDPAALRARVLGPLVCFVGGVLHGTTSIASPLVGSCFHSRRTSSRWSTRAIAARYASCAATSRASAATCATSRASSARTATPITSVAYTRSPPHPVRASTCTRQTWSDCASASARSSAAG